MKELWLPVVGYEDVYEISNLGNLVRISSCTGKPCRKKVKPWFRRGYRTFTLSLRGVATPFSAHRLVWTSFEGPIPADKQLNHKDGDKDNPDLTNLEVVTASENILHSFRELGRIPCPPPIGIGEKNGRVKITESDVLEIRSLLDAGHSQTEVAKRFKIHQGHVSRIYLRKNWPHI